MSAVKTAWGDVTCMLGEMASGEALSTALSSIGVLEESAGISLTTEAGTSYNLKDINGNLLDQLKLEPTLKVAFSVILSKEAMGVAWDTEEDTDTGEIKVFSLIQPTNMSFSLSNPKAIGSWAFVAAKCSISMSPTYAPDKGYLGAVEVTLLKPNRGENVKTELFSFVPVK